MYVFIGCISFPALNVALIKIWTCVKQIELNVISEYILTAVGSHDIKKKNCFKVMSQDIEFHFKIEQDCLPSNRILDGR